MIPPSLTMSIRTLAATRTDSPEFFSLSFEFRPNRHTLSADLRSISPVCTVQRVLG